MKIVTTIPLAKGNWTEDLTYFTAKEVKLGDIVSVPLRKKNILGLVTSVQKLEEEKINIKDLGFNLKKIIAVKDNSIFRKEYLDACIATSEYFVMQKNSAIASLIPNTFLEHYDKINLYKKENEPEPSPESTVAKPKAEKLLLQMPSADRVAIYKTLIRENFALKKSIFLALPTERDIEKYKNLLSKGIEPFTFTAHSALGAKKILAMYKELAKVDHPILFIGTVPFLSIQRKDLGVIILEHESSNAYRTISRPYLDLRTFAEIFSARISAKLIIADTLLRFETIGRQVEDNLQPMYPLSYRLDFGGDIEMCGLEKTLEKKFTMLSKNTLAEIIDNSEKGKNTFIFSLRKGLATITVCKDCASPVLCNLCGSPVVLYTSRNEKKRMLFCNRCKNELDADTSCKTCGSWNLLGLGIGTDTVYEYLKENLPNKKTKILKLDKESAQSAKGAKDIVDEFEKNPGSILIGTEMAFFYMEQKSDLSVIASFDSLWSIPNFKISEKIVQIIINLLEKTEKKLIIQTKNYNDEALLSMKNGNLVSFVRNELADREKLGYPPYMRFIKITFWGNKADTLKIKDFLKSFFQAYNPDVFSGFHPKEKEKYVTHALLRVNPNDWSREEISLKGKIDEKLAKKLRSLGGEFFVSVDPEDLL